MLILGLFQRILNDAIDWQYNVDNTVMLISDSIWQHGKAYVDFSKAVNCPYF